MLNNSSLSFIIITFVTSHLSVSLVFSQTYRNNNNVMPVNITLVLNTWTQVHLNGSSGNYKLTVDKIPGNITYLLIRAHSFRYPVTLASAAKPEFGQYVTSSDAGMTSLLTPGQADMTWYLSMAAAVSDVIVHVLVTSHDLYDPVPGACSQEFPLEYDPNIHLSHDPNIGAMAYQYSNVGFPRAASKAQQPDCESQWDRLSYDIYIHYISSTNPRAPEHFKAVKRMTYPEDIVEYGTKMLTLERGQGRRPKAEFMAYAGQGVIYNVIVTQTEGRLVRRSAYIPSTSYSCSLARDQPNSCDTLDDRSHPYKAIATTVACAGALLMLFAHRFLKCNMFAFGFLSFTLLAYVSLRLVVDIDPMGIFCIAAAIGLLGGLFWLMFWWCLGIPVLSVLLLGLTSGYLLASLVFYTPFDNLNIFRQTFNYGMIFSCWVMFFNLLALPWPKRLSILASSLIGSYSIMFAVGLYIRSSVPYIMVNSIRKAVIPGFIEAIPTRPYFPQDTVILTIWVVVFLAASAYQFYSTRTEADFPLCPRTERRDDRNRSLLAEESANEDDRRGLLSQVSYPSYRALDETSVTTSGQASPNRGITRGYSSLGNDIA